MSRFGSFNCIFMYELRNVYMGLLIISSGLQAHGFYKKKLLHASCHGWKWLSKYSSSGNYAYKLLEIMLVIPAAPWR